MANHPRRFFLRTSLSPRRWRLAFLLFTAVFPAAAVFTSCCHRSCRADETERADVSGREYSQDPIVDPAVQEALLDLLKRQVEELGTPESSGDEQLITDIKYNFSILSRMRPVPRRAVEIADDLMRTEKVTDNASYINLQFQSAKLLLAAKEAGRPYVLKFLEEGDPKIVVRVLSALELEMRENDYNP